MSNSSLPPQFHKTRLSDFGAFRLDVSTIDTHEYTSVVLEEIPETGRNIPLVFPSRQEESQERGNSIACSSGLTRVGFRKVPALIGDAEKTVIMASISPEGGAQWQQEHDTPRDNISVLPRPAHRTPKKWVSVVIRCGITILLLAFLFKSLSWASLVTALVHSHHALLLIGLSVGALGLVISSYQWHVLMRGERISLDLAELINLYMVGVAFSHFLPTGMGGDAVKALYAGRETNNKEGAASAVLMSRLTGLVGMLVVAVVVLIVYHQLFPITIVEGFLLLSLVVSGMIVGALFFVSLLPRFSHAKWAKQRIFSTLVKVGSALQASMRKPRFLSIATAYGMLFWVTGCLNYYTYAIALGIHLPLYFYFVAISLISLISFLPISINGFGVREGAFVYIFASVHVASSVSALLALLMDTQVLFFGVLGGLIYLTMNRKTQKVQARNAA